MSAVTPLAVIGMITDATAIINALTPLIQNQMTNKKYVITEDDVKHALHGKDAALARFDALIAERKAEG